MEKGINWTAHYLSSKRRAYGLLALEIASHCAMLSKIRHLGESIMHSERSWVKEISLWFSYYFVFVCSDTQDKESHHAVFKG